MGIDQCINEMWIVYKKKEKSPDDRFLLGFETFFCWDLKRGRKWFLQWVLS